MEIVAFLPQSLADWPGKVVSVAFVPNCNFKCKFCYNYPLVLFPHKLPRIENEKFFKQLEENSWALDGVVITGGEPTLQGRKLVEFIEEIRLAGLGVKLDTNGTNPDILEELIDKSLLNYIAMDIKADLLPEKYEAVTSARRVLSKIKRSINLIKGSGIDYEFRTTYIPSLHTPKDIYNIVKYLHRIRRYVLQEFRKSSGVLDKELEQQQPAGYDVLLEIANNIAGRGPEEVRIRTEKGEDIIQPKLRKATVML